LSKIEQILGRLIGYIWESLPQEFAKWGCRITDERATLLYLRFLVLQKFNNLPYMPLEDMIRRTIELLAEAERNVALNQRLNRPKYGIISGHTEIDPGVPMVGSLMTTDNSREIDGPSDQTKMKARSDLSDLLQRLSVLTAIKNRCAAMASGTAAEHIEEIKGTEFLPPKMPF